MWDLWTASMALWTSGATSLQGWQLSARDLCWQDARLWTLLQRWTRKWRMCASLRVWLMTRWRNWMRTLRRWTPVLRARIWTSSQRKRGDSESLLKKMSWALSKLLTKSMWHWTSWEMGRPWRFPNSPTYLVMKRDLAQKNPCSRLVL